MAVEVLTLHTFNERVKVFDHKKLGSGSSAHVYAAVVDGERCAVKVYITNAPGDKEKGFNLDRVQYARLCCVEEAKIHALLKQQGEDRYKQHIIPLKKSLCVPSHSLYVNVFECGQHSLFRYMHRASVLRIQKNDAVSIMMQIMEALQYLHSLNVAHCDLSSGNIVQSEDGRWRIIDLGACKVMSDKKCLATCGCTRLMCRLNDQYVCSRWYRSPEVRTQRVLRQSLNLFVSGYSAKRFTWVSHGRLGSWLHVYRNADGQAYFCGRQCSGGDALHYFIHRHATGSAASPFACYICV